MTIDNRLISRWTTILRTGALAALAFGLSITAAGCNDVTEEDLCARICDECGKCQLDDEEYRGCVRSLKVNRGFAVAFDCEPQYQDLLSCYDDNLACNGETESACAETEDALSTCLDKM